MFFTCSLESGILDKIFRSIFLGVLEVSICYVIKNLFAPLFRTVICLKLVLNSLIYAEILYLKTRGEQIRRKITFNPELTMRIFKNI